LEYRNEKEINSNLGLNYLNISNKLTKMKNNNLEKTIESLKEKRGLHTELISLYIPPEKSVSEVFKYLKDEISQSQNIKSKSTRKNVLASISSIKGQLAKI
jgi:peptide chain release factor subunit 1